MMIGTVPA